jgi:hypothetical protein
VNRPGAASVLELVLVCFLFTVLSAGAARYAAGQRRLSESQQSRVRFQELVRTTAVIVGGDVRFLAVADITGSSDDSARIRAFRGGGVVCGADGANVWIRYAGLRRPEPDKDSVLLLDDGGEAVSAIVSTAVSDSCDGSTRFTIDPPASGPGGHGLVFETGTYTVGGGALRYRRGRGGRQPLTESLLDPTSSLRLDSTGLLIRLVSDQTAPGSGVTRVERVRTPSLNTLRP